MKILNVMNLFEARKKQRREDEDIYRTPPPGKTGEFVTTAQAARILDVTMSRVRQMIMDEELKSYEPEKGRRDNLIKLADVRAIKSKEKDKGGRPSEAELKRKK